MTSLPSPTVLRFHRLSFVPEGDEVVVGRRDIDSYGVFPADGAALLQQLEAGRPLHEAADWYETTYGEAVDVDEFVGVLADLEFLLEGEAAAAPAPEVRWQGLGRALFSAPAMALYATLVLTAVFLALFDPSVAPRRSNVFFTPSFVAVELTIVIGQLPLSCLHEMAHLLAGRRLGLASRIRLSNRFYFVVFETTMDGLVGVPRRQRYLPMLAGMGADVVAMAAFTVGAAFLRNGDGSYPLAARVMLALAFSTLPRIVWQFYLFLQTDVYYLIATSLGCIDLHGTAHQWLRNHLNRLRGRPELVVDPEAWHPRDRRALRWYGPLMVVGYGFAAFMALAVALPLAWHLFGTAVSALFSDGAPRSQSYDAAALFALSGAHLTLAGLLARRDRRNQLPAYQGRHFVH